jgi:hypothetical protein
MNDVELRDGLFELFPPEAQGDWGDVLRRAARPGRRLRRLLLPIVVVLVGVLAAGSALALTGRLGRLLHGTPVKDLTPNEQFILSELGARGRVELVAMRESRAFYVIRKPGGGICYAVGESRKGLTPAQAELRSRFGAMGCSARGFGFPSRSLPVLDFSYYRLRPGERLPGTLVGLEGFAADPVRKIGVIGPANEISYSTSVEHNVYSALRAEVAGARGIVALGEGDRTLWVQCQARSGCGKYKTSPPPVAPPSATRIPRPPVVRTPVQRGSGGGVSILIRGSLVEADLSRISPQLRRLLTTNSGEVGLGCFKFVRVAGKTFSRGVGVSKPFTTVVRGELGGNPWGPQSVAPFDGCTITGMYGHRWNDAHGFHDAVEIPLTPAGRRYFVERAVARDITWLARARVFHDIRYARQPLSASEVAPGLADRVVPLAAPSETPPVGRLGLWLGPNRRIVLAERAATGRRFYLELRRGLIYRTNLGNLAG